MTVFSFPMFLALLSSSLLRSSASPTPASAPPPPSSSFTPPYQAILNPSFESTITPSNCSSLVAAQSWNLQGNASIQSNSSTAYRAYEGTHFAQLLGDSSPCSSSTVSQRVHGLVPNRTYTLSWSVNLAIRDPGAVCALDVSVDGAQVALFQPTVDTFAGFWISMYAEHSVADETARLAFRWDCGEEAWRGNPSAVLLDGVALEDCVGVACLSSCC